ncbi:MAG: DUF2093 domain-containing protein [Hyphomicrobiales bacterium]
MNRLDRRFIAHGEARLKYASGEYQVVTPGSYVICAVTGRQIPLEDLRYWSAELQEPYADAQSALRRYEEVGKRGA